MECVPKARVEVLKEATPLLRGIAPDIGVPPSRNCTEPFPVAGLSVAVNVRLAPAAEGVAPAVKVTASVLGVVRNRMEVSRSFWRTSGQSLFAGLYGACVSNTVTMPGMVEPPESR